MPQDPRYAVQSGLWIVAAVVIAACSSASSGSTPVDGGSLPDGAALPDGGAAEGGSQPGAGTMGGPCSATGTCGPGLTCVGPALVPGSAERYCAPSCASNADCQPFAQSSYELQVPDTFTPLGGSPQDTNWKTLADTGGLATLSRGTVCAASSGSASGPKVCQFGCPDFMAVRLDASGSETLCSCIPGYSFTADKLACQFGGHQCSIFSYGTDAQRAGLLGQFGIQTQNPKCDACNSNTQFTDTLGCHSNQFFCNVDTTALNGECAETLSTAQFNQCVAAKTNFSCTCSDTCVSSCASPQTCPDCCTCTSSSASLAAPTCTGDGGVTDSGSGDSAAMDGASGDSGTCVDITGAPPAVPSIANANGAPPATGGTILDGTYGVTAVKVYGTASTPGTQVGTFGGIIKILGTTFESVYAGSNVTSFYGAGTFTVTGTTANVTLTCSSTGPGPTSFAYSVTSTTTVDVTSPGAGYTSVITYTKM